MTFKKWMKNYEKEDSPKGDLARDILADNRFPRCNTGKRAYEVAMMYMLALFAYDGAIDTFHECWIDYELSEMESARKEILGDEDE